MELKHLRFFCTVAELEHMTRAAKVLGVPQSFLTKIIKQLEAELGTELFDHVGRNIRLNQFGQAYLAHARGILEQLAGAQAEIDEMTGHQVTTLKIITNVGLYMPGLLGSIHQRNPDLTLVQLSAPRSAIIEALSAGTTDFALYTPPLTAQEAGKLNIETQIVFYDSARVLLPPDHPLKNRKEIYVQELDNEPLVTSPPGYGMRDNCVEYFAEEGVRARIVIETGDTSLIPRFVNQGLGYAFLPSYEVAKSPSLDRECVRIIGLGNRGHVALSWSSKGYKTQAFQLLREYIIEYFAGIKDEV